uniref:Twinkle homolog protein, chloroplastic/mitochondrial n=1 Tax=Elaeis guineensis var. tenera TaxID=51953 RepID=A0A6I9QLQ5_ELAGV|nr:twinkle homolog protein, chloroplastic/mitochondrial [Elaeis guineensis]
MRGQRNPNKNPKTAIYSVSKKRILSPFFFPFISAQIPAHILSDLENLSPIRIMRPLPRRFLHTLLHSSFLMDGSKRLPVRCAAAGVVPVSPCRLLHLRTNRRLLFQSLRSPNSKYLPSFLKSARFCSVGPVMPNKTVHLPKPEAKMVDTERLARLKSKLEEVGIKCGSCQPGQYSHMTCPQCKGGSSEEKSFSLFIHEDLQLAMWSCFRAKCGWRGVAKVSGEVKAYNLRSDESLQVKEHRKISEKDLQLEPLCEELVAYFFERMISAETLRRNAVMQRKYNDQIVIAFTYRRNGTLVGCKYRAVSKKFWQVYDHIPY